ncbi:MAG: Nif3-like dinuclear metal center hexameric protein [Tannerella sp.]|jgi:dinuclear metal center YbgI/SA1388 family protein|nr:Nif3-like dinuclear metal center hexameric protein [Tannerella sp.]
MNESVKIRDVINELERYAPLSLQEGFDNAGVQVGNVEQQATGALLCLDVTEEVVDEAVRAGYNLIVSHHPLVFKPLKSITGKTYIERCLIKACKNDTVIYSAHTNMDNAIGGINSKLAEMFGLEDVRILNPQHGKLIKLVTFVPADAEETVRKALFKAGAGHIGNYSSCSFNTEGRGTFLAGENCNPVRGEIGELHVEPEVRIETIFPEHRKSSVVHALLSAHPYEEPAFDLYKLDNDWLQAGSGIIGTLPEWEDELIFLQRIKDVLNVECLRHSALTGRRLRTVAICGGSGAFLIPDAIAAEADIFITGEAKYNDFYDVEQKILLAVIGHYESEISIKDIFSHVISKKFPTFAVQKSITNTNPIKYL